MAEVAVARAFLQAEVEALEPFDFVVTGPAGEPLQIVEVTRGEDHRLEVRIPGRPPIVPELPVAVRSALRERGFQSEAPEDPTRPWVAPAADADAAVDLVYRVLTEVFQAKPDARFDVAHGSHKAEVEARRKLGALRQRVEKLLGEMVGEVPEQDPDGDYLLPIDDVHVFVAPRVVPGGAVVVRVFAVTNVGATVTPELGLFLARLNFGLVFGRFALDAEHHAIWVDETLLGEHFSDDELRFTVRAVASIADEWDDRLKQMFGGATYQEVLSKRTSHVAPPTKPGHGGYL
jgi:hypothetical protein